MIFSNISDKVNVALSDYLDNLSSIPEPLYSAMKYSVLGNGKRLRPVMTFIGASSGKYNEEDLLKLAISIELIHCYSLVHDDLPSMDNDTLRRGKPTTHIRFAEDTAILCGDALLNQAFEILSELSLLNNNLARASQYIAKQAGSTGMIAGQCIDSYLSDSSNITDIINMYSLKTSCLFKASLCGGAIAAGKDDNTINLLNDYADSLGIAYQIADDLLEVDGTEDIIGKNINSDKVQNKLTLYKLLGVRKTLEYKNLYEDKAYKIANKLPIKSQLCKLLDLLVKRIK